MSEIKSIYFDHHLYVKPVLSNTRSAGWFQVTLQSFPKFFKFLF